MYTFQPIRHIAFYDNFYITSFKILSTTVLNTSQHWLSFYEYVQQNFKLLKLFIFFLI